MTPDRWQQIKEIFHAALEHEPAERSAFLASACAGDELLSSEVARLVAASESEGGFIDAPAYEIAAEWILDSEANLLVGRQVNHYKIIAELGAGGMGEVYLAQDTKLGRKIALKLLPVSFTNDRGRLQRFQQEARTASALNHPNIVTIYEIGEQNGRHFIATELIEGETLRARISRKQMNLSEAIDIVIQVASALSASHAAGIIHRDIKPENIMMRDDGIIKVLDFGLAKLALPQAASADSQAVTKSFVKTNPGMVMGTVHYMSPEQARGEEVDARTDIWSLGVVLYEMVAGRVPFAGETPSHVIVSLMESEPLPLERYPGVPAELERIVSKTLQKKRDERYQTAGDLALDLKTFTKESELEARLRRSPGYLASQGETAAKSSRPSIVESHRPEAITSNVSTARPTSSTAYLVNQVVRHKRVAALAAATIVLAAVAYFIYFARNGAYSARSKDRIESIAVLPFRSQTRDVNEDYLGLGITNGIITRVSQTGVLTVRPTSAVLKYGNQEIDAVEAARELRVDAVIEGTYQRVGDQWLVSVKLIRVEDGASLWAENFDEYSTDIFAIQDQVSQQVAQRLQLKLSPSQQQRLTKRNTSNPEAYNYYVKAMYHFGNIRAELSTRPESDLAVDLFKKAIELDPNYALAHAQLGYTYARIAVFLEDNPALIEQAKEELAIAERIDPQLAEVHAARYFIAFSQYEGWQVEAAIRELRLAQQLNPSVGHSELGDLYIHIGLEKQAVEEFEIALKADPNNDEIKTFYINLYFISARPDEALEASQRFFNRGPDFGYYLEKRMVKEAEPLVEQAFQKEPRSAWALVNQALLLALQGKQQAAEAAIPSILKGRRNRGYHHVTYHIARIYALGGNSEGALKSLREAVKEGFPCYPLFARDSFLDPIRNEPAFIQFLAEMKTRWEGYQAEFG